MVILQQSDGEAPAAGTADRLPPSDQLAHELRGPMTPLLVAAGLLQDLLLDEADSEQGSLADLIQRGAERLLSRIDELVEVVALSRGASLQLGPVDPNALLAEIAVFGNREAQERGQRIELASGTQPTPALPLQADAMRLRQAVLGLLHVAMGRSVEGSTIYLKASSDREGILIEVVRPGERNPEENTSLGMTLAQQVAGAHHGRCEAREQEGQVAYRFTLPLGGPVPKEAEKA